VVIIGPHACVWRAWRSVGFRSGHTVGGMCMQPVGVAIVVSTVIDRHADEQRPSE
jgi:hypothetical protein